MKRRFTFIETGEGRTEEECYQDALFRMADDPPALKTEEFCTKCSERQGYDVYHDTTSDPAPVPICPDCQKPMELTEEIPDDKLRIYKCIWDDCPVDFVHFFTFRKKRE